MSLLGSVIAGGISGGAKAQGEKLRADAEELRKRSYLDLMKKYQREETDYSHDLSLERDEVNRTNAQEDRIAEDERALLNIPKVAAATGEAKRAELAKQRGFLVAQLGEEDGDKVYKAALGLSPKEASAYMEKVAHLTSLKNNGEITSEEFKEAIGARIKSPENTLSTTDKAKLEKDLNSGYQAYKDALGDLSFEEWGKTYMPQTYRAVFGEQPGGGTRGALSQEEALALYKKYETVSKENRTEALQEIEANLGPGAAEKVLAAGADLRDPGGSEGLLLSADREAAKARDLTRTGRQKPRVNELSPRALAKFQEYATRLGVNTQDMEAMQRLLDSRNTQVTGLPQ
jgi:hypothetical protein